MELQVIRRAVHDLLAHLADQLLAWLGGVQGFIHVGESSNDSVDAVHGLLATLVNNKHARVTNEASHTNPLAQTLYR